MADGYLEKRYDEVFGKKTVVKRVGQSLETLLTKNRSCRGYDHHVEVTTDMLQRIVEVNTKIASGMNQQVLRFKLVTKENGADKVLQNIKLGAALPELHLPFEGTEPEAFIIVCASIPENRIVDIDLGISVQSMTLKAVEMGLNGIVIAAFNKANITAEFHLTCEPIAIVAIGKSCEQIKLVSIRADEKHAYYRKDGIHYVPKLTLHDLILP